MTPSELLLWVTLDDPSTESYENDPNLPDLWFLIREKPAGNYMFKVHNTNIRKRCKVWPSVSIVNFEQVNADWEGLSHVNDWADT